MKTCLCILFFLAISKVAASQTTWSSCTLGAAQNSLPYQYSNIVSQNGDVTIAGNFIDSILGPGGTILSYGHRDIVVARYSATGQLLWLKTAGGPWNDEANGIAEDHEGNIYVTGSFTDTAYFDNLPLYCRDTIHADPSFRSDVFIIKYDISGNQKWVKRGGSIWYDNGQSIVIDRFDNVYVTGMVGTSYNFLPIPYSYAAFDTFQIQLPNLPYSGEMFLTKLDTSGTVKWVKSALAGPWGMTTDDTGNLYITGLYGAAATSFDTVHIHNLQVRTSNMFVVKYDSTGHAKWANGAGGNYNTYCTSIGVDMAGGVYIAGQIESALTYFSNGIVLTGRDMKENAFIAKYGSSGQLIWAKNAGINADTRNDMQGGLVVDKNANVYIGGSFYGSAIFKGDTIQSYGSKDIMVCKYDSSGAPLWFTHAGSNSDDYCNDLAMDSAGRIIISGVVGGGAGKFGTHTLTNNSGNWNMFIAKLVQWPLSINGDPFISTSTLYPNPSSGFFTVKWQNAQYERAIIVNAVGAVVATQKLSSSARACTFFQPTLPNGVYSIGLQDAEHTSFTRLVIRH